MKIIEIRYQPPCFLPVVEFAQSGGHVFGRPASPIEQTGIKLAVRVLFSGKQLVDYFYSKFVLIRDNIDLDRLSEFFGIAYPARLLVERMTYLVQTRRMSTAKECAGKRIISTVLLYCRDGRKHKSENEQ